MPCARSINVHSTTDTAMWLQSSYRSMGSMLQSLVSFLKCLPNCSTSEQHRKCEFLPHKYYFFSHLFSLLNSVISTRRKAALDRITFTAPCSFSVLIVTKYKKALAVYGTAYGFHHFDLHLVDMVFHGVVFIYNLL